MEALPWISDAQSRWTGTLRSAFRARGMHPCPVIVRSSLEDCKWLFIMTCEGILCWLWHESLILDGCAVFVRRIGCVLNCRRDHGAPSFILRYFHRVQSDEALTANDSVEISATSIVLILFLLSSLGHRSFLPHSVLLHRIHLSLQNVISPPTKKHFICWTWKKLQLSWEENEMNSLKDKLSNCAFLADKRFVEITIVLHCYHDLDKMEGGIADLYTRLGEDPEKFYVCNYRSVKGARMRVSDDIHPFCF